MTPLLPSNPMTITPAIVDNNARLKWLRAFDTYERCTSAQREAEKQRIIDLIAADKPKR